MNRYRFVAVLLVALMALGGCATPQSPLEEVAVPAEAPEIVEVEEAITQEEAQAIWDELAGSLAPRVSFKPVDVRSLDAAAVTSVVDLRSVLDSCYREDVRGRMLQADAELADRGLGMGDYPFYMLVSGGEEDGSYFVSREGIRESIRSASNADLFHDWMIDRYFSEEYEEEMPVSRLPSVDFRVYDALDEAFLAPLRATDRVVSVEGTSTVTVTYATGFGWAMLDAAPEEAEWTSRYTVSKRDEGWAIVSFDNFADYAVAQVSAHQAAQAGAP